MYARRLGIICWRTKGGSAYCPGIWYPVLCNLVYLCLRVGNRAGKPDTNVTACEMLFINLMISGFKKKKKRLDKWAKKNTSSITWMGVDVKRFYPILH